MYYLQSRYYDPELCRFISADDFAYISNDEKLNLNAYSYCWNCTVAFDDAEGTTPQLSINLADIISFIKNINNKIKDGITVQIDKLKEKLNQLFENWKNSIKIHYNAFIDKLEYFINYPDAVINNVLSRVFKREINIRFGLIEFIREKLNVSISLSKLKTDVESTENSDSGISLFSANVKSSKNYVSETGKLIAVIITEIFTCLDLQAIADALEIDFSFNDLKEYMQQKVKIYTTWFDNNLWTAATDFADTIAGYISLAADFVPKWEIRAALTVLPYATSALNDFSGRYISPKGGLIMLLYDWSVNFTSGLLGKNVALGDLILETIMSTVFGKIF